MIERHGKTSIVSFKTARTERTFRLRGVTFVGFSRLDPPKPENGGNFEVAFEAECDERRGVTQWFVEEADARAFYADLLAVMRGEAIRDDVRESRESRKPEDRPSGDPLEGKTWTWPGRAARAEHERDVLNLSATLLEAMVHKLADALDGLELGAVMHRDLIAEARALAGEKA